jgi:hypothetical protein
MIVHALFIWNCPDDRDRRTQRRSNPRIAVFSVVDQCRRRTDASELGTLEGTPLPSLAKSRAESANDTIPCERGIIEPWAGEII